MRARKPPAYSRPRMQRHEPRGDRRTSHRFRGPFSARVRERHTAGGHADLHAYADNVSKDGFYAQLDRPLDVGAKVVSVISLPAGSAVVGPGTVVRSEARNSNSWGVA